MTTTVFTRIPARLLLAGCLALLVSVTAQGALVLNEIYMDPPGGFDSSDEYIEIRGTSSLDAGMSLANIFFIAIENEDNEDHDGNTGKIDSFVNLSSASLGTNGFLVITRFGSPYSIAPGTTNVLNTGATLENSGATYMLINTHGGAAPVNNQDLDVGNDGLDALPASWEILDSIGFFSESGEAEYGRLYGMINYGPEAVANAPNYHSTGFEIEYAGRWGDSVGSTDDAWNVSNLTDDPLAGTQKLGAYRQSGDPQGLPTFIESSHSPQVPYGTNLTKTLGASNYPVPEPSSFVLLAFGLVGAAVYALRRRDR